MKNSIGAILLIFMLATPAQCGQAGSSTQPAPTIEQCRVTANKLIALSTADLAKLQGQMTAGDELVYSAQLAKCLEQYPTALSQAQNNKVERFV